MADFRLTQHGTLDMISRLSREAYDHMVEMTADDALWLGWSARAIRFCGQIEADRKAPQDPT
jgi:hypothetical protein